MGDRPNKGDWVKSLDEAGLLDEVEDSWTLPDGPVSGATIQVEGQGGDDIPLTIPPQPPVADPDRPTAVPAPPEEVSPSSNLQDAELQSWEPISAPQADSFPEPPPLEPIAPPLEDPLPEAPPVEPIAPPLEDPLPEPPPLEPIAPPLEDPLPELPPLEPIAPPLADPLDAWSEVIPEESEEKQRVIQVRGSRITVPPAPADADDQGDIVDEPLQRSHILLSDENEEEEEFANLQRESLRPEAVEEAGPEGRRLEMIERFEMGDYSGCLEIAEEILELDPSNDEAARAKHRCHQILLQMYESRIGALNRVPIVAIDMKEVIWHNLDPASGFILSRVDGHGSFDEIIDISGLSRFETCRILDLLLQDGIIK